MLVAQEVVLFTCRDSCHENLKKEEERQTEIQGRAVFGLIATICCIALQRRRGHIASKISVRAGGLVKLTSITRSFCLSMLSLKDQIKWGMNFCIIIQYQSIDKL